MPFSRRQPLTFPVGEESAASSAAAPPPAEAPAAAAEGAGRAVSQVSEPRPPTLTSTAFSTADRGPGSPDNAPYWVALAASVAWIVGVLALAAVSPTEFGARGRGPVGMVVSLLLAAAPLGFVWAAAFAVAQTLRAEQEDFASLAETRTSQLSGFLTGANRDVVALNEVTSLGARSMSELVESAAGKFRELADAARTERELFGASAASSLNTLSEIGANERRALEEQTRHTIQALSGAAVEAREAADAHAEAARSRVEQLNEAAFAAGQRADQVFEARLGEARGLIAQSARLVEEAGASTADKLGQGVAQARSALAELKRMVDDVGADAARLPAETEARAEEIHAAVAKGVDRLLATARRTAEETQAIDTVFQERVKRNYEMLSEAVS